jgi:hypothetical protein
VPQIRELRELLRAADRSAILPTLGRAALIQSPPDPVLQRVALTLPSTVHMAHRSRLAERLEVLIRGFETLEVTFLAPVGDGERFGVGRATECQVHVPEPSVSKLHATLCWHQQQGAFEIVDEGSMNGTFVSMERLRPGEPVWLHDGDPLHFGDAQFLFLYAQTLLAHLGMAR